MSLPTADQRLVEKERIEQYRQLTLKNGNVVDVLFKEAKESYVASRDRLTILDSKAGTLIGIVTTGFGAIALLGDPSKTPTHGLWMIFALAALAIAFGFALAALAPQASRYPKIAVYNVLELVANPANEPRVKFDLTEAWLRDTQTNYDRARRKAMLLIVSICTLVTSLGFLATNYLVSGEKPTPSVQVIFASPSPKP